MSPWQQQHSASNDHKGLFFYANQPCWLHWRQTAGKSFPLNEETRRREGGRLGPQAIMSSRSCEEHKQTNKQNSLPQTDAEMPASGSLKSIVCSESENLWQHRCTFTTSQLRGVQEQTQNPQLKERRPRSKRYTVINDKTNTSFERDHALHRTRQSESVLLLKRFSTSGAFQFFEKTVL